MYQIEVVHGMIFDGRMDLTRDFHIDPSQRNPRGHCAECSPPLYKKIVWSQMDIPPGKASKNTIPLFSYFLIGLERACLLYRPVAKDLSAAQLIYCTYFFIHSAPLGAFLISFGVSQKYSDTSRDEAWIFNSVLTILQ
jgi:hypothetical protein